MHLAQDVHSLQIQDLDKLFQLRYNRFLKKGNISFTFIHGEPKNPKNGKRQTRQSRHWVIPANYQTRLPLGKKVFQAPSPCAGDFRKVRKH